MPLTPEQVE